MNKQPTNTKIIITQENDFSKWYSVVFKENFPNKVKNFFQLKSSGIIIRNNSVGAHQLNKKIHNKSRRLCSSKI